MVNKSLLNEAIEKALRNSDWLELDTYFKDVIDGIEDFQTFYELLPSFLREVFGYEQAGTLDSLENVDISKNSFLRYLGPRSNFFFCLEKCSASFTFFFPVSNLPVWLKKALEEQQSPVVSRNGILNAASSKDAFIAFCKGRLRQSAEAELELNTIEYFLFCLIANTYWKRALPMFEGDSTTPNRAFLPAVELRQLLSPKQVSGRDQTQLCLKLERWLFLHLIYLYLVYLIPRNETLCLLNGRDNYFVKKYGEFFWRLFCNFYIFTEESCITSSVSLPSKFTFCVLTVAFSYICPFFGRAERQAYNEEQAFSSNKKEFQLFSTEDAWNSSVRSIVEFFHICCEQWSDSQLLVDFLYLVCCIFVMATPWIPLEKWLSVPSQVSMIRLNIGSSYSPLHSSTRVTTAHSLNENSLEGTETLQQDTNAIDWSFFISRYKDLYGALIPFVIRKAAILGAFKNLQFFLLLKALSNSFHCRTFEEEDSLSILIRDAYSHISETYDHSLYSVSKTCELCPLSFFHQGIYRDLKNFQGETLKLLFESWKQWRLSSRIGMVLQSDITFNSSSELRFPKEFLKEFRGLFLLLNLGPSSVASLSLVEDASMPSSLFHRPSFVDRSNVELERSQKSGTMSISHRKGAIRYRGDPWLAPLCSYECESLVHFLYRLHLFLVRRFGLDMNFRFLASYVFMCYAAVFYLLCILLWKLFR